MDRKILLKELFDKSKWLVNKLLKKFNKSCFGGCGNYKFTRIKYKNIDKNLCYDCFIEENEELEEIYKVIKEEYIHKSVKNIFNMFYPNIKNDK